MPPRTSKNDSTEHYTEIAQDLPDHIRINQRQIVDRLRG